MEISPEEEERLHKEKERLERELEISEYLREQERKSAEYAKEIVEEKNSWRITYLAFALVMTLILVFILMGNQ